MLNTLNSIDDARVISCTMGCLAAAHFNEVYEVRFRLQDLRVVLG